MEYILDTHAFIYVVMDVKKLSAKAFEIIDNESNKLYLTYTSMIEMAIKSNLGNLTFDGRDFNSMIGYERQQLGITIMDYTIGDMSVFEKLPLYKENKDPFDRLIVAQSISRNIPVISNDRKFKLYSDLKTVW